MTKYNYTILFFFTLAVTGFSQTAPEKFLYQKKTVKSVVSYSLTGPYVVEIPKPKLTQPRVYERSITSANGNYTFVLNKNEKKCTLLSAEGEPLGNFWIKGKNGLDITMADGTVYDWSKGNSGREWKYAVNGKIVFKCAFTKNEGKKYLEYKVLDEQAVNLSTARMISHIYGVDLIQIKATQPVYFGIAIGLGILSAATSSGSGGPQY